MQIVNIDIGMRFMGGDKGKNIQEFRQRGCYDSRVQDNYMNRNFGLEM